MTPPAISPHGVPGLTVKLFLVSIYGAGYTTSTCMLYRHMVDNNPYDIRMKPYTTRFLMGASSLSMSIFWPVLAPLCITNRMDERHQQKMLTLTPPKKA